MELVAALQPIVADGQAEELRRDAHGHAVTALVIGLVLVVVVAPSLVIRYGRASRGPTAKRRYPPLGWVVGGVIALAAAASTIASRYGGPSEESLAFLAIKPGQVFAAGELPTASFKDRSWRVESWSVVTAQKPLRAGGDPCDAAGGVLRDTTPGTGDTNNLFTVLGVLCRGNLMYMPSLQGSSRVWLTPLAVASTSRTWTAVPTLEIRFVEAVAPGESVVWTTSKLVTKTPDGVIQAQAYEQAFRDGGHGLLARPLIVLGLDENSIHFAANQAALDAYHCSFEGDAVPKAFRCSNPASKDVLLKWNAPREEWSAE